MAVLADARELHERTTEVREELRAFLPAWCFVPGPDDRDFHDDAGATVFCRGID